MSTWLGLVVGVGVGFEELRCEHRDRLGLRLHDAHRVGQGCDDGVYRLCERERESHAEVGSKGPGLDGRMAGWAQAGRGLGAGMAWRASRR